VAIKRMTLSTNSKLVRDFNKMRKVQREKYSESNIPSFREEYLYTGDLEGLNKSGILSYEGQHIKVTSQLPNVLSDNLSYIKSKGSHASCDYFYNYHARDYEFETSQLQEKQIPGIYATVANGALNKSIDSRGLLTANNSFLSNNRINKDLFKKIKFTKISIIGADLSANNFQNIMLTSQYANQPEVLAQKDQYPYGIEIKMTSRPSHSEMREFLKNQDLFTEFMNSYSYLNKIVTKFSVQREGIENDFLNSTNNFANVLLTDLINSSSFSLVRSDNPLSIIHKVGKKRTTVFSRFTNNILFKSFYLKLLEKHCESYDKVISDVSNYSEILFYKIEKYVGNNFRNAIQTFYITNDSDSFRLIDTQVKTNTMYNYKVSEVRFVVGNQIAIIGTRNHKKGTIFSVENTPIGLLIEIPVYSRLKAVGLPPPPPPQVFFGTRQDSEKKIFIKMIPSIGEYYYEPIVINQEDEQNNSMIKAMRTGNENKPLYRYYDGFIGYTLYRLDHAPKNYESFEYSEHYEVTRPGIQKNVTFRDSVEKNKKYYYMVQAHNRYGLKSFPSTIYEVELVQSGEDSKIVQKEYQFPTRSVYAKTIKMRSLLQVIPSGQQTVLDPLVDAMNLDTDIIETNSYGDYLDRVRLGNVEERVWGRNFKIRLTSKDTGRKIDLNVKFDIKKKKSNQQL